MERAPYFIFFLLLLVISSVNADESEEIGVPEIPPATCSFNGDKLCPGIPGWVVQKNLQQGACGESLAKYCGNIEPGEGRLAKCLRDNGRFLDAKCKSWGKDVGLNFVDQESPSTGKPIEANTDVYLKMFGAKPDPCFGSAWFTNSNCRNPKPEPEEVKPSESYIKIP